MLNEAMMLGFKATVFRAHTVSFFSSVEDLAQKCTQDLRALLASKRFGEESTTLAKTVAGLSRARWLNDGRFHFLRERLGPPASQVGSNEVLKEILEFLLVGDRQSATYLLVKRTKLDMRAAIDLAMKIECVIGEVVQLGTKHLREPRSETNEPDPSTD